MQGTSLTKQERECKLYDEFDKFTYKKGEMLHEYYLSQDLLLMAKLSKKWLSCTHKETVQNSNSSAQQDVLILSMFEQLNTQVMHCTNVNKALTTELDRYKEEVKDLKEMQNVENNFSGSNEQYAEIVRLKETLSTSVPALDPSHSSTTIKVEVPKELPKVSMVYTSLKELKRYLTGFDLVVKERTTTTAITEAIDNDIVKIVVNLSVNKGCDTVNECQKCLELKTELLNKKDFVDKETYDKLCKSFTTLWKNCITLEADSQT
ncbi:hypothetical protein Tco_0494799 [Tanacetum coccineum]